MTSFRRSHDECNQLDYRLLQNGGIVGYTRMEVFEHDLRWLEDQGYILRRLDASNWESKDACYLDIKNCLGLPDYFQGGLDALRDSLRDIEVPTVGGLVVAIRSFERLAHLAHDFARALLDILEEESRDRLLFGERWLTLLQTIEERLNFGRLGARGVSWDIGWFGRKL